MGFSILKLQLFVYGYMGFLSGIAGVVQSYTVLTVAPDSLLGYELTVLAAVVLGGAQYCRWSRYADRHIAGGDFAGDIAKRFEFTRYFVVLAYRGYRSGDCHQYQCDRLGPTS